VKRRAEESKTCANAFIPLSAPCHERKTAKLKATCSDCLFHPASFRALIVIVSITRLLTYQPEFWVFSSGKPKTQVIKIAKIS
jgi:hypothetical protein